MRSLTLQQLPPVTDRSKTRACGRSLAGIAGLNPAGGMDVSCECCVVRQRSLRRADPSSRGVLPTVLCHCVWSRNLHNEAAWTRVGLLGQREKKKVPLVFKVVTGAESSWSDTNYLISGMLLLFRFSWPGQTLIHDEMYRNIHYSQHIARKNSHSTEVSIASLREEKQFDAGRA